jgi:hypothetical protein
MSRQNKVNPGIYTQRGRLTQDDAARELRKQRPIAPAAARRLVDPHTTPRPAPAGAAAREAAPSNAKAKAAIAKPPAPRASKSTVRDAKTRPAAAAKKQTSKPTRKAVLARNAGGPGAGPRPPKTRGQR